MDSTCIIGKIQVIIKTMPWLSRNSSIIYDKTTKGVNIGTVFISSFLGHPRSGSNTESSWVLADLSRNNQSQGQRRYGYLVSGRQSSIRRRFIRIQLNENISKYFNELFLNKSKARIYIAKLFVSILFEIKI